MIGTRLILLITLFFITLLTALAFAGSVNLPRTGQQTCYDENENVIDCTGTGHDGDIQAGSEWPSPRFLDNGDGTVTDNLTGLMWLKDANCFGARNWYDALSAVADFNINPSLYGCTDYAANYTDWVLPNNVELESLVNAEELNTASWLSEQGFTEVMHSEYWSSTSKSVDSFSDSYKAWYIKIYSGTMIGSSSKYSSNYHLWPVRGGQSGNAKTWRTGQTEIYSAGDDGDLQRGVSWPEPRFEDNGNGTITDHLTGLIWLRNANCAGSMEWKNALTYCNNLYSGVCGLSDGSTAGDWRLPNRKELFSLIDYSKFNPALPKRHLFDFVKLGAYWSSSTYTYRSWYTDDAWRVGMTNGGIFHENKSATNYVWPVRDGSDNPLEPPVNAMPWMPLLLFDD